ncbi:16S rRNA (uracil1498-N3)-methyltransferase [Fibrobacter sp. UWB7]|nr:16S rRNA (uracil1498-N3)-methyltransferase [Fibrobacter sp. UWB7]
MTIDQQLTLMFAIFTVMKTPDSRFYCPLISVGTIILDENESSHAVRVCRAANGDTLQLCDGLGHYADATITKADSKACEVRVDTVEDAPFKRPRLNLGIACLKDDALEEVVFHAAQTETDSIIFLRTDYSQEPKNSDLKKTVRRAELKSLVSLKQSKKPWMTRIEGPIEFDKWLKDYQGDLILCDIDGERKLDLEDGSENTADGTPVKPVTLLVGPEGGFSPREIEAIKAFKNGKVHLLNLGNTRLRARTAAIIALGKVL